MFQKYFPIAVLATFITFSACEKAMEYNTADIPTNFTPLAAPKTGEGYQLHLPAFPVPAQFERELYVRLPLNNPTEILATGFEVKMRPGSHHFILYNFDKPNSPDMPEIGVIRDQNLANGDFNLTSVTTSNLPLFQAAAAEFRIDLPAGYAFKVPANASFDANPHYFNKTDATRFGEVYANIYTKPAAEITTLCNVVYNQPEALSVKPNTTTVLKHDYIVKKETHYVMLTSHYHKRGKKFEIQIIGGPRDGEQIYYSEDYEHPLWKTFQPELVLQPGEGLRTTVTYENETSRTIPFGVTSEDEMNIMIDFSYEK
jgi:Copper type II ascorbate-dependent monooxygenase, C-terminal domain